MRKIATLIILVMLVPVVQAQSSSGYIFFRYTGETTGIVVFDTIENIYQTVHLEIDEYAVTNDQEELVTFNGAELAIYDLSQWRWGDSSFDVIGYAEVDLAALSVSEAVNISWLLTDEKLIVSQTYNTENGHITEFYGLDYSIIEDESFVYLAAIDGFCYVNSWYEDQYSSVCYETTGELTGHMMPMTGGHVPSIRVQDSSVFDLLPVWGADTLNWIELSTDSYQIDYVEIPAGPEYMHYYQAERSYVFYNPNGHEVYVTGLEAAFVGISGVEVSGQNIILLGSDDRLTILGNNGQSWSVTGFELDI